MTPSRVFDALTLIVSEVYRLLLDGVRVMVAVACRTDAAGCDVGGGGGGRGGGRRLTGHPICCIMFPLRRCPPFLWPDKEAVS